MLTFSQAAEILGSTRYKIWYLVKAGFWKPSHFYGSTYFVESGDDLESLRQALSAVGTRFKLAHGKYLANG